MRVCLLCLIRVSFLARLHKPLILIGHCKVCPTDSSVILAAFDSVAIEPKAPGRVASTIPHSQPGAEIKVAM